MKSYDIVGFAWEAALHCERCYEHAQNCDYLKRVYEPGSGTTRFHLVDHEGNEVTPLFADKANGDEWCDDCGERLME